MEKMFGGVGRYLIIQKLSGAQIARSISVSQVEHNISKYHTIWLICLIAAICFLIVAIVLFFVLKIPTVFMIITGLSKRKEIKEMDENSAYTVQLSRRLLASDKKKAKGKHGSGSRKLNKNAMITQSGRLAAPVGSVPVTNTVVAPRGYKPAGQAAGQGGAYNAAGQTPGYNPATGQQSGDPDYEPTGDTTTLYSSNPDDSMETSLLSNNEAEMETSLLSGRRATAQKVSASELGFRVVQEILLVHTEEDII